MRRRTLLGGTVLVAVALGAGIAVGLSRTEAPENPKSLLPLRLGDMRFSLSDHDGWNVGPQDLVGRATMVFFGFTSCPDVCPTTLADITGWLEALGEDADLLNVVFITVDPTRDTVEAMAEYVGYFHPMIRGWTGSPEEIARAADGFRATYERVPDENGSYTMNHTAGIFLFDAEGRFRTIIDYHESREFALPKIRRAMDDSGV
ncbi:SCO family protein [Acuticoccus sp. MNP-M23]|uniref:SCO family protein n=1 Tax=Acuticoccus sp. MNP-M23 TaxID=3072793 RepID=UPI0035BF55E6